jgi:hypothetical protein
LGGFFILFGFFLAPVVYTVFSRFALFFVTFFWFFAFCGSIWPKVFEGSITFGIEPFSQP